jgi:histidine triad (HIT) family protein
MSEDCIFCKIIKGEIPSSNVYDDDSTIAFLDIAPVNKGHVLVIPKNHYETILDTPEDELKAVIATVKKVTKAVKSATNADGITIGQSNYEAAGQTVPHLHFHIMPRFSDDGLKLWPQGKYDDKEMDKVKDKIINSLES